ncbi:MAG: RbsD/FucU domain-containing protein, partial [Carnobacterium sp.]
NFLLKLLDILIKEMMIEVVILASEIKIGNPEQLKLIEEKIPKEMIHYVSHEEFKKKTIYTKAIIRTGEATPYSNIILQSGVLF